MAQNYNRKIRKQIRGLLTTLAKDYNITKKDQTKFMKGLNLQTPLRKKTILTYEEKCKARKQDGTQCSRRHQANSSFCGKHIKNQRYGVYELTDVTRSPENVKPAPKKRGRKAKKKKDPENKNELLTLKSVQIKDKYYYIDKHNILYNPEPVNGLYEIIGKLTGNLEEEIYYATSISS